MTDTVTVYVALGANLGDPVAAIAAAFEALGGLPDTRLVQRSPLYRTAPVDSSGPDYVNAVAEIATRLEPLALLQALQAIETAAGRTRPWQNAPRTLDLDLVLYGDRTIALPTLTVPHPRMADRAFVLRPLQDIAPHRVSAAQLAHVADQRIDKM